MPGVFSTTFKGLDTLFARSGSETAKMAVKTLREWAARPTALTRDPSPLGHQIALEASDLATEIIDLFPKLDRLNWHIQTAQSIKSDVKLVTELIGPQGNFPSDKIRLGLCYMPPHIRTITAHTDVAETLVLLAGPLDLHIEGDPMAAATTGDIFDVPNGTSRFGVTHSKPSLVAFAWTSDIHGQFAQPIEQVSGIG